MKAIVQEKYGSPSLLELQEVEKPVPDAGEVLVRVRAASVLPDVWHVVMGRPYVIRLISAGLLRPEPKIPGTDVAGVVESVGEGVTAFAAGDAVFGETVSGYSWRHGGAYAEYASVAESSLSVKPDHLTFEQAAVIPTSGMIALRSLSAHGGIEPADKVLVNGAGGNVGSLAVQFARALGAEVTGVDCGRKMGLMRSLGADRVVDYDKEDATQGSRKYDFILDVASTLSLSRCKRVLSSDGSYVMIGHDHFGVAAGRWLGSLPRFAVMAARSRFVRHVSSPDFSIASGVLMSSVARIVETKTIAPIVDRVFPLDESARAIEYIQGGQSCGAVVVSVD